MATLRRFLNWLVSTLEGRVLMVLIIGLALFKPDLLTKLVRSVIGGILGAILNGITEAIGANQSALSSLFILALMIWVIVYMFKGLLKKGGGKSK
jgi:hypothetical protein